MDTDPIFKLVYECDQCVNMPELMTDSSMVDTDMITSIESMLW